METKEIIIQCPEGYEIDKQNSTFEKIVFKVKEKPLPTKWKDLKTTTGAYISTECEIKEWGSSFVTEYTKNIWPSVKLANAALALCQLIRYRDAWNEGWQPNYRDLEYKYAIRIAEEKITPWLHQSAACVLTFKSKELRDKFQSTFEELILIAKPLL